MKSTLNFEVYLSFERVSSDHQVVSAKVRLSLRRNNLRNGKALRYSRSSLANRDIDN